MILRLLLIFLITGAATPLLAHSPHDEILAIQFSPRFVVDLTVFAIVRYNLFRSRNRGLFWSRLARGLGHARLTALAFVPVPQSPLRLIAGDASGQLFSSDDDGENWKPAGQLPGGMEVAEIASNAIAPGVVTLVRDTHGNVWRNVDEGSRWEPTLSGVCRLVAGHGDMWAGTKTGALLRSGDRCSRWEVAAQLQPDAPIRALAFAARESHGELLAAAQDRRITVLDLSTHARTHLPPPRRREITTSLAWGDTASAWPELYASTWKTGVHRWRPDQANWEEKRTGLTTDPQADSRAFRVPHFRQLALSPAHARDRMMLLAGFDGLFASHDAAESWTERRALLPNSLIVGLDAAARGEDSWDLAVATYGGGLWLRSQGDREWRAPKMQFREGRLFGVTFSSDYARDQTLFVLSNWSLYRSTDRGETWTSASLEGGARRGGAHPFLLLRRSAFALAATAGERVVRPMRRWFHRWRDRMKLAHPLPGFGATVRVSPTFASDQTLLVHTANRAWRSQDGGKTLQMLPDVPAGPFFSLAFSPRFTVDRTLALGTPKGVWLSRDAGKEWRLVFSPAGGDVRAVFFPHLSDGGTLAAAAGSTLWLSRDEGRTWLAMTAQPPEETTLIDAVIGGSPGVGREWLVHRRGDGIHCLPDDEPHFSAWGPRREFSHLVDFPDRAPLLHRTPDGCLFGASGTQVWLHPGGELPGTPLEIPTRYEAVRSEIAYSGNWRPLPGQGERWPRSRGVRRRGAKAALHFVGTAVRWIGEKGPGRGTAAVFLDGTEVARIDLDQAALTSGVVCFESGPLPPGPHQCVIEANPPGNATRRPGQVVLHAFDVEGGA